MCPLLLQMFPVPDAANTAAVLAGAIAHPFFHCQPAGLPIQKLN
jgi:hypothetical protein